MGYRSGMLKCISEAAFEQIQHHYDADYGSCQGPGWFEKVGSCEVKH